MEGVAQQRVSQVGQGGADLVQEAGAQAHLQQRGGGQAITARCASLFAMVLAHSKLWMAKTPSRLRTSQALSPHLKFCERL